MPTIHDLPLETIGHIITIAHPVDSDDDAEQRARRHFYLDTSLVCRDWTPFAQRALWKDVRVDRRSIEELVDSGGAGRYPVERLSVDGDYVGASVLGILLTSVRGVRDLKLENCIIDACWLAGNNWRDLKALELSCTDVTSAMLPAYHFALAHLTLDDGSNDVSDQTLIALSRQVSITSLKLNLIESAVEMVDQLSPLASQLVRLELNLDKHDDDLFATERQVNLFLPQCIQLKHLTSFADNALSVIHLPSPLKSWTATWCDESCVAPILDVLKSKAIVISKLQHLCIQLSDDETILNAVSEAQGWEGWLEIEEACRQKKIKLSVGIRGSEEEQVLVPSSSSCLELR